MSPKIKRSHVRDGSRQTLRVSPSIEGSSSNDLHERSHCFENFHSIR